MAKIKDEVGNRYGRLTVLHAGKMHRNLQHWVCLCDCGRTSDPISGASLRHGITKSCGCLKKINCASRTHGMTGHPALESYKGAKARCTNPSNTSFDYYGGKGIEFRLPPFQEFWAKLGQSWFVGATLERKENDGHYELGNVVWATRAEQNLNTRRSVMLTLDGETKNLSTWAAEIGINLTTLRERIQKWGVELALTTPKRSPGLSHSTHKERP